MTALEKAKELFRRLGHPKARRYAREKTFEFALTGRELFWFDVEDHLGPWPKRSWKKGE